MAAPLSSFVPVDPTNHFPIQNLPYGVFRPQAQHAATHPASMIHRPSHAQSLPPRVGVALGEFVVDLSVLADHGIFGSNETYKKCFHEGSLNSFMSLGRSAWTEVRTTLQRVLSSSDATIRDNEELREAAILPMKDCTMDMPAVIGDYTDFYSSKDHAVNVGTMIRGKDNSLMPNWVHLPVGYHGRSSSIVVSGTPIRRPVGQLKNEADPGPVCEPCKRLDFELETAFFVGPGNKQGEPISIKNAKDHIFGMVLMNDWSARDVQTWEYVPLGPFLAKNFATTISPWVVTLDALEPFRCNGPAQNPQPLPYLREDLQNSYNIQLEAKLTTSKQSEPFTITNTNFNNLYWSMTQQLAHHSMGGCNMRPGDLCGSGTISGPEVTSRGSMLEISWKGETPLKLPSSEERKFLLDGDTVILTGFCKGDGYTVGFGECSGTVKPAVVL